jgi:hypothetical protein
MNKNDFKSSLKTRANLRQPSAVMCQNLSEWRQNGSLKFLAKPLKSFLERVKRFVSLHYTRKNNMLEEQ